ncbi:response regulator [Paenibacillus sp. P96]|uniref:Response regulator n=1 Tax=Paenibacillus zeirhizosphaerae TaxID=2987519 RepID=A0ABT9FM81_9BACL|nr:response regulator [Paenibacillus sp. P96]MDP4095841.1 response regulator [Paenibacillus sp. P96]
MELAVKTILVVDDEPRTRQGIKQALEASGSGNYWVETAENGVEALDKLQQQSFHLLITDVRLPEISGLDLIRSMEGYARRPVIVVISGYAEFDYVQQALRLGAVNYLLKPIDKQELLKAVSEALRLEEERQLHEKLEKFVDPALLKVDSRQAALSQPVKEALDYLNKHMHEPVTMADMAGRLHLNASYFSVLFKEQTGMAFSEYICRLRIQRAKELLLQTRLSVAEIADRVGYRTDKYFIKVFKDLEAVSPSRYRQQMADSLEEIQ